ncbi:hypothetical protein SAMN05421858_1995 [Haladaptatus litoreus]|uniref:Uncharacterized protein n=1 Tax=Haladaptatus litoreus TaxID=553468 RepID=A0A1N6ZE23_9EURY|nr:hypothetical protein [Haladaptatus litoreus]SIR25150.1 hypothetical protein SAMN05421858_1995 [Haladaptatus litoreus]
MGTRIFDSILRYWKRTTDHPDYRQAYVKLPLDTSLPQLAHEFEEICEGRLDRIPQRDSLVIETDFVSEARFDSERFRELVTEIRERCPDEYVLHSSTKWRRHEDGVAKTHTVVPVKPLYSVDEAESESVSKEQVSGRPR